MLPDGVIADERERRALDVLVERVDGVRGIDDRIVCIEPMSGMFVDEAPDGTVPVYR